MYSHGSDTRQLQKRKCIEYHDPDYANTLHTVPKSKRQCALDKNTCQCSTQSSISREYDTNSREKTIRDIISREFQKELDLKHEQMQEIEECRKKAYNTLDRLRYAIVADYYRKQTVSLTSADAIAVRNTPSLFEEETLGPQLGLHPSLRKLVGKKPKNFNEIIRTCPTRAAAQTAKQTFVEMSKSKKCDKVMSDLIRKEGLVIDHSKEECTVLRLDGRLSDLEAKKKLNHATKQPQPSSHTTSGPALAVKTLNTTRLNNKKKQIIVVGNTSKYIGDDTEEKDITVNSRKLSHKWLLYIQTKDDRIPLERLVKKVRFFLHTSYRPNDVIDICTPPFQITRRGWGEFPVRIQMFFVESLQQKPLQLIHNLILDQTRSGLQTLGAETVVEVWLRFEQHSELRLSSASSDTSSNIAIINEKEIPKQKSPEKNAPSQKKIIDDNVYEPINKVEETTKVYYENNTTQLNIRTSVPPTDVSKIENNKEISQIHVPDTTQTNGTEPKELPDSIVVEPVIRNTKPITKLSIDSKDNNALQSQPLSVNKSFVSEISNIIMDRKGVQVTQQITPTGVLQKKTVKLIDAVGNVKYLQMFVTKDITVSTNLHQKDNIPDIMQSDIQPSIIHNSKVFDLNSEDESRVHTEEVASKTTMSKAPALNYKLPSNYMAVGLDSVKVSHQSSNVMVREGKLYIFDPMQVKLKQQQNKQISLLKPQINLLKRQMQSQTPTVCDHDYVPAPPADPTIEGSDAKTVAWFPEQILNSTLAEATTRPNLGTKHFRANPEDNTELTIPLSQKRLREKFLATEFSDTRQAVEYLLRRVPLIWKSTNDDMTSAAFFSFQDYSLKDFQTLSSIKQRVYEWLRAKFIAKYLRDHSSLKTSPGGLWTAREIAVYARCHAYTPPMKSLQSTQGQGGAGPPTIFTNLVKNELKNEKQYMYETLTNNTRIYKWIESTSKTMAIQKGEVCTPFIDVLNIQHCETAKYNSKLVYKDKQITHSITSNMLYLTSPESLAVEFELLSNICKDIGIRLHAEEISSGVLHNMSQTLLAICLRLLVEKLLRLALGLKAYNKYSSENITDNKVYRNYIEPQDIGRAIRALSEFDFLSNRFLGTSKSEFTENK